MRPDDNDVKVSRAYRRRSSRHLIGVIQGDFVRRKNAIFMLIAILSNRTGDFQKQVFVTIAVGCSIRAECEFDSPDSLGWSSHA